MSRHPKAFTRGTSVWKKRVNRHDYICNIKWICVPKNNVTKFILDFQNLPDKLKTKHRASQHQQKEHRKTPKPEVNKIICESTNINISVLEI